MMSCPAGRASAANDGGDLDRAQKSRGFGKTSNKSSTLVRGVAPATEKREKSWN